MGKSRKGARKGSDGCPRCRAPVGPDADVRACEACGAEHHAGCWEPGCAACAGLGPRPGTTIIAPPPAPAPAPVEPASPPSVEPAPEPPAEPGPAPTQATPPTARSEPEPSGATPGALRAWIDGLREEFGTTGAAVFLLVVIGVAAYANCFRVPFLFDDAPVVTRNRLLWQWETWWQLFWWNPGRGLTNLSFLANFQLSGCSTVQPYDWRDWWSFHLVSLAIHLVNGLLVFRLVRDLLTARAEVHPRLIHWAAILGAAVWLAHPANTMAVTYIAQRYALMAALSFLATVVLYVRLRRRVEAAGGLDLGRDALAVLGLGAVATSCLFTKENAWTAPLAVLAVEVLFFGGRYLPLLLGLIAGAAVLVGIPLRLAMVGGQWENFFPSSSPSGDRSQYFSTQVVVTLRYLHLWLMPHDLTVEQSFPMTWDTKGRDVLLALLGHALIVGLAVKLLLRGLRFVPFALAWYYIAHIVESSFIPILDPMVDHRMYLPTALLGAALVVSGARVYPAVVAGARQAREQVALGCMLLVALMVTGTLVRNTVWTSATGIWEDTIQKRPDCARAYSSLGMEHLYAGEWLAAVQPIETALQLGPYHVEGWNNLGKAYLELATSIPVGRGRDSIWAAAATALERGIEVDTVAPSPSTPLCWNNLGLVFFNVALEQSDRARRRYFLEQAVPRLTRATELDPDYEVAWINLCNAHGQLMVLTEGDPQAQQRHARGALQAATQAEGVARRRGGALPMSTYRNRIVAVATLGEPLEAYRLATVLADAAPDDPTCTDDVARMALEATDQARAAGGPAGPGPAPDPANAAAERLDVQDALEDAARRLDAQLARLPGRVTSVVLRSQVAMALGDRALAVKVLRDALRALQPPPVQALGEHVGMDDPAVVPLKEELRRLGETP